MPVFLVGLLAKLILFVFALRASGNTADLYGIVRCVTPDFDPKILALFYGCYCGPGGQGTPVDAMDRCCQAHDECYKASHRGQCSYAWYWPVIMRTNYACYSNQASCLDSQVCPKEQCECDVKLANCLKGMKTPTVRPKCPDYFRAPKAGSSGSSWLTY